MIFMTVQAAIDGLGVAIGRTAFVEGDIAAGRLVVPFDITLPIDVGFYLVCPRGCGRCAEDRRIPRLADRHRQRDKHPLALVPREPRRSGMRELDSKAKGRASWPSPVAWSRMMRSQ